MVSREEHEGSCVGNTGVKDPTRTRRLLHYLQLARRLADRHVVKEELKHEMLTVVLWIAVQIRGPCREWWPLPFRCPLWAPCLLFRGLLLLLLVPLLLLGLAPVRRTLKTLVAEDSVGVREA